MTLKNSLNKIAKYIFLFLSLYAVLFNVRIFSPVPVFVFFSVGLLITNFKDLFSFFKNRFFGILFSLYALLILIAVLKYWAQFPEAYMTLFWGIKAITVIFLYQLYTFSERNHLTHRVFHNVVLAFVVHGILAWIALFYPDFKNALLQLQFQSLIQQDTLSNADTSYRLGVSLGYMFFGGGALYACLHIWMLWKLAYTDINRVVFGVLFVFLFITSIAISKTSYLGLAIGLLFFVNKNWLRNLKRLIYLCLAVLLVAISLYQIEKSKYVLMFAIEPFKYALQEQQQLDPSLLSTLHTSWTALQKVTTGEVSQQVRMFLWGQGRLFSDDNRSYFAGTDMGYLRLYVYGGFFFTLLAFTPVLSIVGSFRKTGLVREGLLLTAIAGAIAILNIKGFIDLTYFLVLISIAELSGRTDFLTRKVSRIFPGRMYQK